MPVWTGVETFDSYANGDKLSAQNGGTGWAAAWTLGAGADTVWTVSNAQSINSPNSGKGATNNGQEDIYRNLTTATSGTSTICHFSFRRDTSSTSGIQIVFWDAAVAKNVAVNFVRTADGVKIDLAGTTTVNLLSSYSLATWYHIYVDIDSTNGKARGYAATSIPNAPITWSSYVTSTPSAFTEVKRVNIIFSHVNNSDIIYFDDIRDVGTDMTAAVVPTGRMMMMGMGR